MGGVSRGVAVGCFVKFIGSTAQETPTHPLCIVTHRWKGLRMSVAIEDGEICPSCGEIPIAFYGDDEAECPNCGELFILSDGE